MRAEGNKKRPARRQAKKIDILDEQNSQRALEDFRADTSFI